MVSTPTIPAPEESPSELDDLYNPYEVFHFDGSPEDLAAAIRKPHP